MRVTKPVCIILIAIILISYSCGKSLSGKIEIRNSNEVYIVNKSSSKIFQFTVKETTITNDSVYEYKTQLVKLSPGDEKSIGVLTDTSDKFYPIVNFKILRFYLDAAYNDSLSLEKRESNKDPFKKYGGQEIPAYLNEGKLVTLPDTIINGEIIKRQYIYRGLQYRLNQLNDTLDILSKLTDTTIRGLAGKYEYAFKERTDSLHPIFNSFKYKYEITGQIELEYGTGKAKSN